MTKLPTQNMNHLLEKWQNDSSIAKNIAHFSTHPARSALSDPMPPELQPVLKDYLSSKGINQLYTHQHQSWQAIGQGKNIVIVTGTASGKTLCYNLPFFQAALNNATDTALYLFPTKALAQDQKKNIDAFASFCLPPDILFSGIYDGDTPSSQRTQIRTLCPRHFDQPGHAPHLHSPPPHLMGIFL